MAQVIEIDLSTDSLDDVIRKLEMHQAWVRIKQRKLAERLAFLGGTVASLGFSRALYDGDNDVNIEVEETDNGYSIHAKGEAVAFIEFGTGIGATSPKGAELGFTPGSWSEDHAKQFSEKGYWYYNGKRLVGIQPGNYMYQASKEIKEQLRQIALEVFREND